LLARRYFAEKTKGYRNHPQTIRFRKQEDPLTAIGCYLKYVYKGAVRRGYAFKPETLFQKIFNSFNSKGL